MSAITDPEFAALMAQLGPFEPAPRLAAAVSGGSDSMALALLAHRWAVARGGTLLALIVDHRLRPNSGQEATDTADRLLSHGIASHQLDLTDLKRGPGLAERARAARYAVLAEACHTRNILHLLLGHHAADQAETVLIRALSSSGAAGLSAMARVTETTFLRLLRPLLFIPPSRLRETLVLAGLAWVEDPSNADPAALRPRLRAMRADRSGQGPATLALVEAAAAAGRQRAQRDYDTARLLATLTFRPEGFILLHQPTLPPDVLAAVLQTIAGAEFPIAGEAVRRLAAALRPATLGGARLLAAPRLGGLMVLREAAAMLPPIPACPGAVWDRRFRLGSRAKPPAQATLGALSDDAARFRRLSELPAALLRTLPALRQENRLVAVPHLGFPDPDFCATVPVLFAPPRPAAGAAFFTA